MTNRTRESARTRNQTTAQHPSPLPPSLQGYAAHMAVDCIITLALFKAVPWLEIQITLDVLAVLGDPPRRSCIAGEVIRLTRERARLEGWPWPSFEDVVTQMAKAGIQREDAR